MVELLEQRLQTIQLENLKFEDDLTMHAVELANMNG